MLASVHEKTHQNFDLVVSGTLSTPTLQFQHRLSPFQLVLTAFTASSSSLLTRFFTGTVRS